VHLLLLLDDDLVECPLAVELDARLERQLRKEPTHHTRDQEERAEEPDEDPDLVPPRGPRYAVVPSETEEIKGRVTEGVIEGQARPSVQQQKNRAKGEYTRR